MLRRVPKALKVGFRAGFNSFVVALKPTRRVKNKVTIGPKPPLKDAIAGDLWLKAANFLTPVEATYVFDGTKFRLMVDRNA